MSFWVQNCCICIVTVEKFKLEYKNTYHRFEGNWDFGFVRIWKFRNYELGSLGIGNFCNWNVKYRGGELDI